MKFSELLPTLSANGKDFEQIVGWMFKNHPEWSANHTDVWQWDEYPHRWARDKGIDLVIRDDQGRDWAVQAKNYASDYYVTKADIDSWLAESARQQIHGLILVATTNHLGENAREVLAGQEKTVVQIMLDDLMAMDLDWPSSAKDLNKVRKLKRLPPKPHQRKAIKAVVSHLRSNDKCKCIMACGTGKSYTGRWIAEALGAQATLVLVPTLNLIRQISKDYRQLNSDYRSLIVCSDEYAGKDAGNDQIKDVPVTSSPEKIRDFLQGSGEKVIFSTYHSSNLVADAQRLYAPAFDLVICDEAHNLARHFHEQNDYTCVLDESRIKSAKRVFMTATPRSYSNAIKDQAEVMGIELACMNEPQFFGEEAYVLSFREAIDLGLIRDYKVLVTIVNDEEVYNSLLTRELYQLPEFQDPLHAKEAGFADQLVALMQKYQLQKGITFHSSNEKAKRFSRVLHRFAPYREHKLAVGSVAGTMNSSERAQVLSILSSAYGKDAVVSNCQVLTEGVNVPELDFVSFCDPKNSKISVIQAISRALRLSGDKTHGYVLLPVFVPAGETPEQAVLNDRFASVIRVTNLLAQEDDAMYEELNTLRIRLGQERPVNSVGNGRIIVEQFEAGIPVNHSFFAEALFEHLIDRSLSSNFQLMDEMVDWAQSHGGQMPRRTDPKSYEWKLYGRFRCCVNRFQHWPQALKDYAQERLGEYDWYHPKFSENGYKAQILINWILSNGRFPIVGDIDEATGVKVGLLMNGAKNGRLPEVSQAMNQQFGNEWKTTKAERGWHAVANFIRTFRRLPIAEEEHQGYKVALILKGVRRRPSDAFAAIVDPVCQEIGITWKVAPRKVDYLAKVDALIAWIEANGRFPIHRDKDENGFLVGRVLAKAREHREGAAAKMLTERYGDRWLVPNKPGRPKAA